MCMDFFAWQTGFRFKGGLVEICWKCARLQGFVVYLWMCSCGVLDLCVYLTCLASFFSVLSVVFSRSYGPLNWYFVRKKTLIWRKGVSIVENKPLKGTVWQKRVGQVLVVWQTPLKGTFMFDRNMCRARVCRLPNSSKGLPFSPN